MNTCVLSLGSNVATREEMLKRAISYLGTVMEVDAVSDIYTTEPWGGGDKMYANCVLRAKTGMCYDSLNALLKRWEEENGRDAESRLRGDVPVDVDVVCWNGEIVRPKELEREYFLKGYRRITRGEY